VSVLITIVGCNFGLGLLFVWFGVTKERAGDNEIPAEGPQSLGHKDVDSDDIVAMAHAWAK
jgi:hypothetical protein